MLTGWIMAEESDAEELRGIGVEVGPYELSECTFNDCRVSDEAMRKLEHHWHRWIWSLQPEAG